MRLFDETFWKMLLGFIVMLVIGLASIFITGYFGTTQTARSSNPPIGTVKPAEIEQALTE